jgi:histidine ammonia-lyase
MRCSTMRRRGLIVAQRSHRFARGHFGARWSVIELAEQVHNRTVVPSNSSQGLVGASGDLAPAC